MVLFKGSRKFTDVLIAKFVGYFFYQVLIFIKQFFSQLHLLFLEELVNGLTEKLLEFCFQFAFGNLKFLRQEINTRKFIKQMTGKVIFNAIDTEFIAILN